MKNSHLKNILISGVMAVLLGIVVLGVNAAVGEGALPDHEPDDGVGVSPTFNGLTVKGSDGSGGDASIEGQLRINDANDPSSPYLGDADLYVNGRTDLWGVIENTYVFPGVDFNVPVSILDDLLVGGHLIVSGLISNNSTTPGTSSVMIDDRLEINPVLDADGKSEYEGDADLYVNGDLEIGGIIQNLGTSNGGDLPVKIDDDLDVTGAITNANTGIVQIKAALGLTGFLMNTIGDSVVINDGLRLTGSLDGVASPNVLELDKNGISSIHDKLYLNKTSNQDVQVGDENYHSDMTVHGSLNLTEGNGWGGGITASGAISSDKHITADQVGFIRNVVSWSPYGTFEQPSGSDDNEPFYGSASELIYPDSAIGVGIPTVIAQEFTCPHLNDIILDCTFVPMKESAKMLGNIKVWGHLNDTKVCTIAVQNLEETDPVFLKTYLTCFDPNTYWEGSYYSWESPIW